MNINPPETEKSAEVIGKSFYRTLRENGFSEKQIIYVAINMIDCLTDSIRGDESGKEQKERHQKLRVCGALPGKEK